MAKEVDSTKFSLSYGNMNNLMKQAQKMQKQMAETTKALEEDLRSNCRRRCCFCYCFW